MYLDDGLGVHDDEESCKSIGMQVKNDLIHSGFVPKAEKSLCTPTKTLVWLGTYIDTDSGFFSIPENHIQKIMNTITEIDDLLAKRGTVFVRKVASFVGQFISTSLVVGNIALINFWRHNINMVNVKHFKTDVSCQSIVYSNASNIGYGGYCVENPYSIAHGMWSEFEFGSSFTWKELTAVRNVFLSLIQFLSGKTIKGLQIIKTLSVRVVPTQFWRDYY